VEGNVFHSWEVLGMKGVLWARVRVVGSIAWKGCDWLELLVIGTRLTGSGIFSWSPESNAFEIGDKNGRICYQTTMGMRLQRYGEVWIVDEKGCFWLYFIENMERKFRSTALLLSTGVAFGLKILQCQQRSPREALWDTSIWRTTEVDWRSQSNPWSQDFGVTVKLIFDW